MKKPKKKTIVMNLLFCLVFLAATGAQLARLSIYQESKDNNLPVISYSGTVPVYRPGINEKLLLADVTAADKEDRDVTSELRIRSINVAEDMSGAVVTYVVRDRSNNIATAKRAVAVLKSASTVQPAAGPAETEPEEEEKKEEAAAATTAAPKAEQKTEQKTEQKKEQNTQKTTEKNKNNSKSNSKSDKKN